MFEPLPPHLSDRSFIKTNWLYSVPSGIAQLYATNIITHKPGWKNVARHLKIFFPKNVFFFFCLVCPRASCLRDYNLRLRHQIHCRHLFKNKYNLVDTFFTGSGEQNVLSENRIIQRGLKRRRICILRQKLVIEHSDVTGDSVLHYLFFNVQE